MHVAIRAAVAGDAELLAELARRTFVDTFAADNDPANIAVHVASSFGAQRQRAEIVDPDVRTLVAEVDGIFAAFAQVRRRPAPSCVQGRSVELWRFYVDRPFIGRGVAARLMDEVFAEAARLGANVVWLGVWERNPRAIRFYAKHGFVDVGTHVFQVGDDAQTDRVMRREVSTPS